jgi:hypothetical protein
MIIELLLANIPPVNKAAMNTDKIRILFLKVLRSSYFKTNC